MTTPINQTGNNRGNPSVAILHRPWLIISGVLIIAWLIVVMFYASRYSGYNYPDEAANAFFAKQFAQTSQFTYDTGLTPAELSIYHPRSVGISGSFYVPGSFVGFITLHGLLQKIGSIAPTVFTWIIFLLAILAWYCLVRRYWDKNWALFSIAAIITLPAVVAFLHLPWLHAMLLTSFFMLTGWALVRYQERQTWVRAVMVGICYGAALFIRPVEALWTFPAVVLVMIVHRQRRRFIIAMLVTVMLMQLPWMIMAKTTFGTVLGSGYTTQGLAFTTLDETAGSQGLSWYRTLIPPGGWSWHFFSAAWESLFALMPAVAFMTVIALAIYFKRKFVNISKVLKIGAIMLFVAYYLVYYGSLDLAQNGPAVAGSITSYVRYWLPLIVAMVAGVVVTLRWIYRRQPWVAIVLAGIVLTSNMWSSVWHFNSGLRSLRQQDLRFQSVQRVVKQYTEANSLIITGRYDKTLLASRIVSYRQPITEDEWTVLSNIVARRPVYLIGSILATSEATLRDKATAHNLVVTSVTAIDDSTLWRLQPSPSPL